MKNSMKNEEYHSLVDKLNEVRRLVDRLRVLVPRQSDSLDTIVAGLEAEVSKAAGSRKLRKIKSKPQDDTMGMALSGDILNYDPKQSKIDALANAINARFTPKFDGELGTEDDVDMALNVLDSMDIEASPDDLIPFSLARSVQNRRALSFITGAILPNGKVVVTMVASDRVSEDFSEILSPTPLARKLSSEWPAGDEEDFD
jgi:hypothetical protein